MAHHTELTGRTLTGRLTLPIKHPTKSRSSEMPLTKSLHIRRDTFIRTNGPKTIPAAPFLTFQFSRVFKSIRGQYETLPMPSTAKARTLLIAQQESAV